MFSNRGWLVKFSVPLLLFAGLCLDGAWRLAERHPTVRKCLANPDRYDGREIWAGVRQVREVHPDGFTASDDVTSLRVKSDDKPGTGTWVSVKGIFRRSGILEASAIERHTHWRAERSGAYGVSGVVVVAWLWFFLKRFRLGVRGGLFHPRPRTGQDAPPLDAGRPS